MPAGDILIVSAIAGAFALFGLMLAWGDLQCRQHRRELQQSAEASARPGPIEHKKAA